jgi:peroxiredoxin
MVKFTTVLGAAMALGITAYAQQPVPYKTHLKVGDPAPEITFARTSAGQPFKLSDFKGKKTVVVAFFPAAFSGG